MSTTRILFLSALIFAYRLRWLLAAVVLGAVVFAVGHWLFTHVAIDARWLP